MKQLGRADDNEAWKALQDAPEVSASSKGLTGLLVRGFLTLKSSA
jgi:hypothetical protein